MEIFVFGNIEILKVSKNLILSLKINNNYKLSLI